MTIYEFRLRPVLLYINIQIIIGHCAHIIPVSERGRRDMVKIGTGQKAEHFDHTGYNRDQQPSKRPERRNARLRVSRRERAVHLPRLHAEFVSDPVPYEIHLGHVRMSHVFLFETW